MSRLVEAWTQTGAGWWETFLWALDNEHVWRGEGFDSREAFFRAAQHATHFALPPAERQAMGQAMKAAGATVREIAAAQGVGEATVERDRRASNDAQETLPDADELPAEASNDAPPTPLKVAPSPKLKPKPKPKPTPQQRAATLTVKFSTNGTRDLIATLEEMAAIDPAEYEGIPSLDHLVDLAQQVQTAAAKFVRQHRPAIRRVK